MVALTGHFDGKVIVPDMPVDLPRNSRLLVHVEVAGNSASPRGASGLLAFSGTIEQQDLRLITEAIHDGCEQVSDEW